MVALQRNMIEFVTLNRGVLESLLTQGIGLAPKVMSVLPAPRGVVVKVGHAPVAARHEIKEGDASCRVCMATA